MTRLYKIVQLRNEPVRFSVKIRRVDSYVPGDLVEFDDAAIAHISHESRQAVLNYMQDIYGDYTLYVPPNACTFYVVKYRNGYRGAWFDEDGKRDSTFMNLADIEGWTAEMADLGYRQVEPPYSQLQAPPRKITLRKPS